MKNCIAYKVTIALVIPFLAFTQIEQWVYRYDGSWSDQDIAYALAYGLDGNIYAVGKTVNMGSGTDFVVVSLKDNGDTNWMYLYDGVGYEDMAMSVAYGTDNNIYAAGMSGTPATYSDLLVLSLTTDGDTNWTYRYDSPGSSYDEAHSIAYGLDGNIYVAGSSANDVFVVSLSSTGDTNWTYRHSGSGVSYDGANSIVYGADGNIYVAGVCCGASTSWDFFVMSLSAAGDTNWTYCYDGGQSYDAAFSLVYGLDNNVYAAGYSTGGSGDWYFTVISLGCIGSENWTYTYSGDLYEWNGARAITYGADSNIYVAGRCSWASSGNDFVVLSLNAAGDTNWTYRLQGSMDFDDDAEAIVYGSDGNIYAAGTIVDAMSARDFAVVSLDENGTENWVYTYTAAPTYWWDEAYAITYGLDDKVYAAGYSIDSTSISLWDFTVISLDPVTGIEETKTIPEQVVRLEAIPNPFTYTTDIRCQITDNRQECELKIYDIAGCLVADLSRRLSGVGYPSSVRWDGTDDAGNRLPGGIYFVRAVSNDYCTVERLILIR